MADSGRGDRERGVYAPPPEDAYDARDSGRRGLVILIVSLVVLAAAVAMAWSTYNLGLREGGRDAPPRIVADAGPFRTEPADPGGFQAPDQDIEVYDTLSGEERQTAERFAPPPEAPLEEALTAEPAPEPAPAPQEEPRGVQIVEVDPDEGPVNLRPQPEAPAPAAPQLTAPASAPAAPAAGDGDWLVQLAALRSEEEAVATWERIVAAHPAAMAGARRDIQRADLGERGVYYRLRVTGFASQANAQSFCAGLQQAGQDCIVVAR